MSTSGTYRVNARVASLAAGGRLHVDLDGGTNRVALSFSATGGWQNWITVVSEPFFLTPGVQVMRLVTDSSLFNVNRLDIVRDDATPPDPTDQNLALNKPAVASSLENASYTAAQAVDGNTATRWSSLFSDPQWIYVDLGANYNVSRVRLIWEAAYSTSYKIQVSNDATTWTDIYSTTAGKGGTVDLTSVTGVGRYVPMYGSARGTVWGHSLWEMEVYGTAWQ